MKIYEIGTGYTSIPAQMGAATEIVVEELTKSLLAMGEPVEILDISAEQRAAHSLPITEVKVPRIFTGKDVSLGLAHKLKRVAYSVSLAFSLCRILRKEKAPVVLHFHNQYNLFFFFKLVPERLRRKARISYTVHSYIWHGAWKDIQADVSRRYFQECFCIRHADCVFVLNEQTKQNLCRNLGADEQKIHLINNGVNADTYCPLSNEEILSIKSAHALNGKRILVQVGSVCDRKNQLGAIKMLAAFLRENKDAVYMYAGGIIDKDYQESIKKFAAENQIDAQVIYAGELVPGEILNKYYNAASFVKMPHCIFRYFQGKIITVG